jgi:glycosyltransferase involved in cell wall biosynthesis
VKVIFLNRFYAPDISATSQLLTDLARSLAASGWDVQIVTSRQRYDDPRAGLPKEDTIEGVQVHRVASTRFGRAAIAGRTLDSLTFCVAAAARLMRLARARDIIVAMTDPPLVSVVGAWVARRRGAMLVNWLQDVFPEVAERLGVSLARGVAGRMARRLRDYSLRSSRANVVLSESMEAAVRAAAGDACGRGPAFRVIHNWADGALVRPLARDANPMRREWGLQDAFVVGYSGNIGRVHEFDTLLDAAERLRDVDGLAIAISGGGNQAQRLRDEVDRRGLAHVFRFHGYQPRERLRESLCVADAHLVTLRPALEGLVVPSKFYGIAAAGRCVLYVGDAQGELARTIARAECGIAIPVGDAQGLAGAICMLLDDPAMTRRMGENARYLFEARFDRPRAMEEWTALLTALPTEPAAFDGNRQPT